MSSSPAKPFGTRARHWIVNAILMGLIRAALALPYRWRVPLIGWIVSRVIGPLAGYRRTALENLAKIMPDLPEAERRRIADACIDNAGRTFIEKFSADEFFERQDGNEIHGDGWPALQQAVADGRPVILVTGHYGNYEAARAAMVSRGLTIGGLFRDLSNSYFNANYVRTTLARGGPGFAQGRKGTAGFVRHLKTGGILVILIDQHVFGAPVLDFMGHPARTALSAGELALRYDALLIPYYGIRNPDGLTFRIELEAPIAHTDPETMTLAFHKSLEARIRARPDLWFWVHRRWRPEA